MLLNQNFYIIKYHKLLKCPIKRIHTSSVLWKGGANVRKKMLLPFQKEKPKKKRKISVIGSSGFTGSLLCYTLFLQNFCDEIVMFDIEPATEVLCGHALDILHGTAMRNAPNVKVCTNFENTADSDVIIINAGRATKKKNVTRLDLCQSNIKIVAKLIPPLAKLSPKSVIIISTNPTEIIAYTAWKYSCFDKNRIIGAGCELDGYRFRFHLANRLGINPNSVNGLIIGEHGLSSVPVWSTVNVAGARLRCFDHTIGTPEDDNDWNMHEITVGDGPRIVGMKGRTDYGISMTVANLAKSVITNSKKIHCVSVHLNGLYGIKSDCFVSMPCVIGNRGVKEVVQIELDSCELEKLQKSVAILDKHMRKMEFP